MKQRARLLIGLSLAALAACLAACLLLAFQTVFRSRRQLRDGSTVTLEGVSFGRRHRLDTRPWWQKLQQPSPVSRSRLPIRGPVYQLDTTQDALVVWIRRHWLPQRRRQARGFFEGALDEHGCRFPRPAGAEWTAGRPPAYDHWMAKTLTVYPRRGPQVLFGFFDINARDLMARFEVPNPTPGPYPAWAPEPYPIRKPKGDLEFVLEGLTHAQNRVSARSLARFRVEKKGRPVAGWEPVFLIASDATGNSVVTENRFGRTGRGAWFDGLCVWEAAWKLRVQFACLERPRFVWSFRDLPKPGPGESRALTAAREAQGIRLEAVRVDADEEQPGNRGYTGRRQGHVRVRVRSADAPVLLTLLQAEDERGRDLAPSGPGGSLRTLAGAARVYCRPPVQEDAFRLRLPGGTRRLNLTFAVYEVRTVEYLARP